ncbi:ectonucleotide pyrophosphatase/phosphodiesterase family member 7 [Falco biarmicus]|uniref:ectonucleotide pyrophosphatase/phosphodiesterase family member 7 n=1 Tax=Falco cherrug TaxID=345164 RepID=UPI002478CC24|nr:ectonucleotide pyrophosphatase/phosphodiesterase family member 7 [Falco cherrug]XP_056202630.1 ectonucleotide pyrophosphatase/phosphodiesterase family member 7 [Falco biarmicus]
MFASLGLLFAALSLARCVPVQQVPDHSKVLLVSFDGFRWNYDQDVDTPNLDAMAAEGVKAQYMTPAFITITSPCHFTLLTGRYLENHGVIHNMWFNTSTGQKLPYHSTQGVDSWWDNGSLPIWITAQRQGLKTGSIYFPGGKAKYQGEEVNMKLVEPLFFNYSNETNWRENIDTAMEWFTVNNLDFIALYFGEPDSTGHKYGPESPQRKTMIEQVDRTVGYLRQRIQKSGLESNLNLIITSDHGMETVIKSNEIHIKAVENFTFKDIQFELLDYGPNGLLVPKEGKLEHVYSVLKNAHPNLHVYKKADFPRRFHYANHTRITPLVLYSDPGYVIHGRYKVQFNKGEHGFDNEAMNMKTIFRAVGPAFKQGLVVEPFESVHVYALLCELLGIAPEPHDGALAALRPLLRSSAPLPPAKKLPVMLGIALILGSSEFQATLAEMCGKMRKDVAHEDNQSQPQIISDQTSRDRPLLPAAERRSRVPVQYRQPPGGGSRAALTARRPRGSTAGRGGRGGRSW